MIAAQRVTTYEEWRVTGRCQQVREDVEHHFATEAEARAWLAEMSCTWTDGPHLHKRTVTVTDWEAVA